MNFFIFEEITNPNKQEGTVLIFGFAASRQLTLAVGFNPRSLDKSFFVASATTEVLPDHFSTVADATRNSRFHNRGLKPTDKISCH